MKIKDYSLSAIRNSEKHKEPVTMPSMVDTSIHNPTLGEILERYTKTGQLMCSQRQSFYDDDENPDVNTFEDITDLTIDQATAEGKPDLMYGEGDKSEEEGGEGGETTTPTTSTPDVEPSQPQA